MCNGLGVVAEIIFAHNDDGIAHNADGIAHNADGQARFFTYLLPPFLCQSSLLAAASLPAFKALIAAAFWAVSDLFICFLYSCCWLIARSSM